jgi:cytoskeletal protein CcmA (bactofilin family)
VQNTDILSVDPSRVKLADDLTLRAELDAPDGITSIGRTIVLKGEVRATEHLIIEGRVDGQVTAPNHGVAIGQQSSVSADILARTITVRGCVKGNLTATERVEILATGRVEGRVVAPQIAIDEGAYFKGGVDPKLTATATAVGLHRLKQRADHS